MEFTGNGPFHTHPNRILIDIWDRWDSSYYRGTADSGYLYDPPDVPGNVAFFPMYPLLLAGVHLFIADWSIAGILLSHFNFFLALLFLYKLTVWEFGSVSSAQRTLFYIALFPTAFFFSAIYTESTFLLFSVATIYFGKRQKWVLAGIAGMLATATRFTGIGLYIFLLLEWVDCFGWAGWRQSKTARRAFLWVHLSLFGLGAYIAFLAIRFGDPLAFINAQSGWGRATSLPFSALWRDLKGVLNASWFGSSFALWRVMIDVIAGIFALFHLPFIWRKLSTSYAAYTFIALLIPNLTNSTQSLSRYVLVIFPIFMVLGDWGKNPLLDKTILIGFTTLLAILTAVFVNWGFVA